MLQTIRLDLLCTILEYSHYIYNNLHDGEANSRPLFISVATSTSDTGGRTTSASSISSALWAFAQSRVFPEMYVFRDPYCNQCAIECLGASWVTSFGRVQEIAAAELPLLDGRPDEIQTIVRLGPKIGQC